MEYIATTLFGLEEVLQQELERIDAQEVKMLNRAVHFSGDVELMYKANLRLRTALKVLEVVGRFPVQDEEDLYRAVKKINWGRYIDPLNTIAVAATTNKSNFNNSHFVALKAKDGIVDHFRDKFGKRPSVDIKDPDLNVHIHIFEETCTISVNTSGDPLFKRGYKKTFTKAPINEVLAAGLVMMTGWNGSDAFVDPMCGSGTLAIEAGLLAGNIAPGSFRSQFGFMRWKNFKNHIWQEIYKKALLDERRVFERNVFASDASLSAIKAADDNIAQAEVGDAIKLQQRTFENLKPPAERGVLLINPPYGQRIKTEDTLALYKQIGDQLKQHWAGFNAYLITSNMEAIKQIGLRPSFKKTVFNGQLECKFLKYELYEGSKKAKKKEQ